MAKIALDTDQKKKVFVLAGLAGLLGIVGLVVLNPFGRSTSTATETATTSFGSPTPSPDSAPSSPTAPGAPAAPAEAAAPAGSAGTPGTAAPGAAAPPLAAAERFRTDPFVQYYTVPAPFPTPVPTPIPIPPPVDLPDPNGSGSDGGFSGPLGLPSAGGSGNPSAALVGLPQARVSRLVDIPSAPRVQVPPPSRSGGQTTIARSGNKRLAGVIIGDSVRALLEIQGAGPDGEDITRVVQPGDEVEGVRVLRIERFTEGGNRTRVRMVVRENGEERSVDLRAGAQRTDAGAEGGYPGSEGSPGSGSISGSGGFRPGGRPNFPPPP